MKSLLQEWLARLRQSLRRDRRHWVIAGVALFLPLQAWWFYSLGHSGHGDAGAAREQARLGDIIDRLKDENARLRQRALVLQGASAVDRQAYGEIGRSLQDLQDEVLELKQEVEFYRGIVSPGGGATGLRIQGFKVEPNGQPGGYSYHLVLTQVLVQARPISGAVTFAVQGVQNGVPKALTLRELGGQAGGAVRFRFKYFQGIEGDVALPAGFAPLRAVVRVTPVGSEAVEQVFRWPGA